MWKKKLNANNYEHDSQRKQYESLCFFDMNMYLWVCVLGRAQKHNGFRFELGDVGLLLAQHFICHDFHYLFFIFESNGNKLHFLWTFSIQCPWNNASKRNPPSPFIATNSEILSDYFRNKNHNAFCRRTLGMTKWCVFSLLQTSAPCSAHTIHSRFCACVFASAAQYTQ